MDVGKGKVDGKFQFGVPFHVFESLYAHVINGYKLLVPQALAAAGGELFFARSIVQESLARI